jgi:hypothetical protein
LIINESPIISEADQKTIALAGIEQLSYTINSIVKRVHRLNYKNFYVDPITGKTKEPTPERLGTMIALMHSELSEMLEGVRKGTPDSHLPNRSAEEVELADLVIRAFDYAGYRGLDLQGAMLEKLRYNCTRADHTAEERRKVGGKKF